FGSADVTASGRGDLQMEVANEIAVWLRRAAFDEERGGLQLVRRRREAWNRAARDAKDKVGAKVSNQVLPDQRQRRQSSPIERKRGEARPLDRPERDDGGAARREVDESAASVDAAHPPRTRASLRGAQRQHVRVGQDHEFLPPVITVVAEGGPSGLH